MGLKASIVTNAVLANDAMGNHIRNTLAHLEERGYETHIFYDDRTETGDTERFHRLTFQQLIEDTPSKLQKAVDHFYSSDLYIYNYGIYYPLVESIRLAKKGITFFDFHGVTPPELSEDSPDAGFLHMGVHRAHLVHLADYAIVHSRHIQQELVDRYGYPKERTYVLPYAIPTEHFHTAGKSGHLERTLGLAGHSVLLYVGRLAPHKRVDQLVEALALVKEHLPGVKLLLIGDDKSPACAVVAQKARELARQKGIEKDVLFLGTIEHRELQHYYNLADVYVTSSLHEGFCIPVVEAMACGVPVIATRAAALPYTVGGAGLLFAPSDVEELAKKILRLLTSPELHRELAQKGLARARLFTQEKFEERLDRMFTRFSQRVLSLAVGLFQPLPPVILPTSLELLRQEGDIAMRDYVVRSNKPLVGRFIVWVRRNVTSHLKEPYVDPIIERQVNYNLKLLGILENLQMRMEELERRQQQLAEQQDRLLKSLPRRERFKLRLGRNRFRR